MPARRAEATLKHPKRALLMLAMIHLALSCGGGTDRSERWKLVPAGSIAAVRLAWPEITADPALRKYSGLQQLEPVLQTLAIPSDAVDEMLVFSDGGIGAVSREAAIVFGSFDEETVTETLVANGWQVWQLGQLTAYRDPTGQECAGMIDTEMAAIGSCPGLEALDAVLTGTSASIVSREEGEVLIGAVENEGHPVRAVFLISGIASTASRLAFSGIRPLLEWQLPEFLAGWFPVDVAIEGLGAGLGRSEERLAVGVHIAFSSENAATACAKLLELSRFAAQVASAHSPADEDKLPIDLATLQIQTFERVLQIGMLLDERQLR